MTTKITKVEACDAVGFFDFLWVMVETAQISKKSLEKLLDEVASQQNREDYIEKLLLSTFKTTINDLWEKEYFKINDYQLSVYWTEAAKDIHDDLALGKKLIEGQSKSLAEVRQESEKRGLSKKDKKKLSEEIKILEKALYSNKYFVREHVVPQNVHGKELLKICETNFVEYMVTNYKICIVTNNENQALKEANLNDRMPERWNWRDGPWARYDRVKDITIQVGDNDNQSTESITINHGEGAFFPQHLSPKDKDRYDTQLEKAVASWNKKRSLTDQ